MDTIPLLSSADKHTIMAKNRGINWLPRAIQRNYLDISLASTYFTVRQLVIDDVIAPMTIHQIVKLWRESRGVESWEYSRSAAVKKISELVSEDREYLKKKIMVKNERKR